VAYPLRSRQLEALSPERGVSVDQATMHRWALQDAPQLEAALHRLTRPMDVSWRLDETSIGVWGHWHSLDRADDTAGQPVDVRRTAHRDESAAKPKRLPRYRRRCGFIHRLSIDLGEDVFFCVIEEQRPC
jgi:putative transposase